MCVYILYSIYIPEVCIKGRKRVQQTMFSMTSKVPSCRLSANSIGFPWPNIWDCLAYLFEPKYLLNMKTTSVLGPALGASAERTALSNILHPVKCVSSHLFIKLLVLHLRSITESIQ